MKDVSYRLTDIIGKNIYSGSRGIYVYKVNKKGKRYRFTTIGPNSLVGQLKSYQIFDSKQVGKSGETWVLFLKSGGFIFLPKGERNLIDVTKFEKQGIKTDEQQIKENTQLYNKSPLTSLAETIKNSITKYPTLIYLGGGLILYKILNK